MRFNMFKSEYFGGETVSCSHLTAFARRSWSVKHFTSLAPSELTDFAAMNEYMTRIHMQNKPPLCTIGCNYSAIKTE